MIGKVNSEAGFSTLVFLALLLMLSLLGINAIMTATDEVDIAGYELNATKAFYAAEAGLEEAAALITDHYEKWGKPPNSLPSGQITFGAYTVNWTVTKPGATQLKTMTTGAYRGLYALSDEYQIESTASSPGVKARTKLTMTLDASVVPIYQFAVFYEDDLEIAPSPPMTIGGRVHSNNDMYLQSNNSLTIDSYTTAAGSIYHGRSPKSGKSDNYGDVLINDKDGTPQNMKNPDGSWLDATDPDWVSESISRWGGLVEDKSHGITKLNLPVVSSGVPKDMINRAGGGNADSYEHKADLKLIDGVVWYRGADSIWNNVTTQFTDQGILTNNTFYDGREQTDANSWDLDLGNLGSSSYWPASGIIYVDNDLSGLQGTRLVNGAELHGALTVASANPLYTVGNYNTINKKAASVMTDAYTVLSNDWNDADSWSGIDSRIAGNTQVNVAYMTGNKPSGAGSGTSYSGGFENLPRFLEDWSGKTFTWIGSAVDLWESEQATGYWSYGGYYTPPDRNWFFDLAFLDPTNLPPGTPLISVIQQTSWNESIAYID
ncbi:MAG: hypothetical protein KAT58_11670 [candidate division Zixibacteria bacterium]|nr:hypothetical protein [candidate division Zixibacteria bacterium]